MRNSVSEGTGPSGVLSGFVTMTGFDIEIDGDGSNAFVTLVSSKVGTFRLKVAFALLSRLHHAIDIVVDRMLHRQHAFLDEGEFTVEHVKACAPSINAEGCEITLDEQGQVVALFQFRDNSPPIAVKMTPDEAACFNRELQAVRARLLN